KKAVRSATLSVENVPLPRPRPPFWPEPHSFAEAAGPDFDTANLTSALSDCDQRLAEMADIELLSRRIGPGECGGRDLIRLNAVLLPNRKRVEVRPTAVLRCAMAESLAAWTRLPVMSPRWGTRCAASIPTVHTNAVAVIGLPMPKSANTAKAMPSTFVPWFWQTVATSRSLTRHFQSRFAKICEIPLVIALRRCWGPAPTATTMTTSISTVSSEMTEPVFPNPMSPIHRPRRLKPRAAP